MLKKRDKQFLIFLMFFSVLISIIETVGISVIMPFIAVATDFSIIHSNQYYNTIYNYFKLNNEVEFILLFGMALICFYLFRSAINLIYFYTLSKFTQSRYYILAYRLFENYMGMPYKEFVKKNTSTLTKSIVNEATNLVSLIQGILVIFSEVFIVIFIYAMMLYVNYKITLLLTLVLVLNAILMVKFVSARIKKAGAQRVNMQKIYYEVINKSFGNFKLIKLNANDNEVLSSFSKASYGYANANITNQTLNHVPRLFLEAVAFSIIVFIVSYLVYKYESNISGALSIISMFVLALYRLMPSVNRIMNGYNQVMFNLKSLDIVHNDLMYESEDLQDEDIRFKDKIILFNIDFEYEEGKPVLENINLLIEKGEKVAFVGESGSGKSTLVDILIGLYKPKNGKIIIDNVSLCDNNVKAWRKKIGYIPQSVYLFDGTVAQNIAFGNEENKEKLIKVLKQANIYDFLQKKNGLDTKVGEGGIMLSGGQKQRIAIARALYNDPEVLVLDEATSALDNDTEKKIMDEIYESSKDKTLIIIAHRLSTVDRCDRLINLEKGNIKL